jgi:hypothetical protein
MGQIEDGKFKFYWGKHELILGSEYGRPVLFELYPIDFTRWDANPARGLKEDEQEVLMHLMNSKIPNKTSWMWVS